MGAVCAIVYLLTIIVFIPFPFYKDIVAATSGGGNRDVVLELQQVETGRFLHKFPHSKVGKAMLLLLLLPRLMLNSWPRTCLRYSHYSRWCSWVSVMICSTYGGDTSFSSLLLHRSPCSWYTLSISASLKS